jgi:long-chain fatty acid adenylyltransferase FadD28
MLESSICTLLRERASLLPNHTAFTFIDYEQDWQGVAESLTWAQLYRRSLNLAAELKGSASPGDRAVVLAPQGLDYIVAFLGALEAGLTAVPLSVPMVGIHDERVTAVLQDASPSVILTTSAVVANVIPYSRPSADTPAPSVVEVDSVNSDSRVGSDPRRHSEADTAYLQYTSGSTRTPTGVVVSNRNLSTNWGQIVAGICPDRRMPNSIVSWLPFYHDMGLMMGLCAGILGGWPTVIMDPISFIQRPARWMQLLARNPRVFSAAPNFAFELAAARTPDADLTGFDLGDVMYIMSGAERVNPSTIKRFTERFARFNLSESVIRPAYGLAEATLFVAAGESGRSNDFVHFDREKLSAGHARRCETGTPLMSYGSPRSPLVRIVDPETATEKQAETVGEIWVRGDNVSSGYWRRPTETEQTFEATITSPSAGTPEDRWLRTGDLGLVSEGELFVVGRRKDLLIVRGRNHYPDDIEATVQELSGGRAAAIAVEDESTENLVVVVEFKNRGQSEQEKSENLRAIQEKLTSAISTSHGLRAEIVLVAPGSIPITTSGKVRRATCVQLYREGGFRHLGI